MTTKTTTKPIHWAQFESRNFQFDAFGATEDEAREALRLGWEQHVALTGADATYFAERADEVYVTEVQLGTAYRDNESLTKFF